jgi:AP-1 complex subunit beta-1
MGCIRVDKITEYLCEPLGVCLKDEDPYVKKTAAICVAKLSSISPEIVEERGFVSDLQNLTSDANPTVVANAVAALSEIGQESCSTVIKLNSLVVQKLLAALNECTEWGQVFILDSLSEYQCRTNAEAGAIIERVLPRLSHGNSAVVMSAFKVILHFLEYVEDEEKIRSYQKKLAPPLITLLNASPEVQYVVLRNINLIVLKHPKILEHEVKVFFCKYNDPIYVKMEKLEILIRLVTDKNIDQILLELKEYSTEVDVDFVRRSVRCIGKCAIKLENSGERCIQVLLDLIETKVNYVVQEAIVVIKDIFRKYPNKYESIIGKLCENLECLDEPEAKASMIWIIGEYADQIEGADDLLESFMDSFHEETAQVQLQLLTATVKLFLKQPDNAQELVQKVLNMTTQESDNPDLRDRGYVYWRLLSSDPEAARVVVMSEKPSLSDDSFNLDPALLDDLISQIGSLASIFHKPAEQFVIRANNHPSSDDEESDDEEDGEDQSGDDIPTPSYYSNPTSNASPVAVSSASNDLLDLMDDLPVPPSIPVSTVPTSNVVKLPLVTDTEKSQGITISGAMAKGNNNSITLECDVSNSGSTPVQQLAIQFNKNSFGVAPAQPNINLPISISNGSTCSISISLTVTPQMLDSANVSGKIQAAMKNMATSGVFYLIIPIAIDALFAVGYNMEPNALVAAWKGIPENLDVSAMVNGIKLYIYLSNIYSNYSNFNIFIYF